MGNEKAFGEWLKQRRRELDLTQEALAERMNCSVVTISKIEMGQRRPSKQLAELLARELRVPDAARDDFMRFTRDLGDLPSLLTPPAPPTLSTLPTPATPLIGREDELAHIAKLLREDSCRMLTLIGPGGIGKTRLALQAARMNAGGFTSGAAFVSLAGVAHVSDVPSAIATSLGMTLQGAGDIALHLISYLRDQHLLLVMDNLEHLLTGGALAKMLEEVLLAVPKLKVLATSRESLHLPGEWTFRVLGLPVPAADAPSPQHSAVLLFVQAAQRADVRFTMKDEDLAAILRICRMVDGVPLAIELAASWAGTLQPSEIADEIASSLDFLALPAATDARQRSMRAVFDQSWRLLTPAEQCALAALSVFRNGFTRNAAEEVAGASLQTLASLLGKSLIQRNAQGCYDLHELVRQFAAEHLENDAAHQASSRHARYYLRLLDEAERKLRSAEQMAMLQRVTDEVDNVRAAWDWAVANRRLDEINAGMRGLVRLYSLKSWNDEGMQRLGAAAALENDVRTVHLLTYQSWFLVSIGEVAGSLRVLDEVFDRITDIQEPHILIEPYLFRALALYQAERYDEAAQTMQRALQLAQQINNRWFEGIARHALAYGAFMHTGETVHSYNEVTQAAEMMRSEGDVFQAIGLLQNASVIAIAAGRYEEAGRLLSECNEVAARLDNPFALGEIHVLQSKLALARGDQASARWHLGRSLVLFQESRSSRQLESVRSMLNSLDSANI